MKTLMMAQGSPEWITARLGIPTASELDSLVSPAGKVRTGDGPETYLYRKVCERLLGFSTDNANSFAMEQGVILESEAIPWYSLAYDVEVTRAGLCLSDDSRFGASPDGLVGEDGGVEIKCFQPAKSLQVFLENQIPKENVMQVQGCLYATQRKWWDWCSYSRQFPALVIRSYPDAKLQAAIAEALALFNERFDAVLARIQGLKDAENAAKEAAYQIHVAKALAEGRTP